MKHINQNTNGKMVAQALRTLRDGFMEARGISEDDIKNKMESMKINKDIDEVIDKAFERLKNAPSLIMKKDGHLMLRKRRSGKSMMDTYLDEKYL